MSESENKLRSFVGRRSAHEAHSTFDQTASRNGTEESQASESGSSELSDEDASMKSSKTIGHLPRSSSLGALIVLLGAVSSLVCAWMFTTRTKARVALVTASTFAMARCLCALFSELICTHWERLLHHNSVFIAVCVHARIADLVFGAFCAIYTTSLQLSLCGTIWAAAEILIGTTRRLAAHKLAWEPYADRAREDLLAQHVVLTLTSHVTGRTQARTTHRAAALRLARINSHRGSMYAESRSVSALPANELYESDAFKLNVRARSEPKTTFDRSAVHVSMKAPDTGDRVSAKIFGENLFDMLMLQHAISTSDAERVITELNSGVLEDALGPDLASHGEQLFGLGFKTISKELFARTVVDRCRKHVDLTSSLADYESIVVSLTRIVRVAAYFFLAFIFARISGPDQANQTITWASLVFAVGFVFSGATNNLSDCCLFVFVTRPFDVGDRICITAEPENQYVVERIGLLSTVCRRSDGVYSTFPNQVLGTSPLQNASRSTTAVLSHTCRVPFGNAHDLAVRLSAALERGARNSKYLWARDSVSVFISELSDERATLIVCVTQHDVRDSSLIRGNECFLGLLAPVLLDPGQTDVGSV